MNKGLKKMGYVYSKDEIPINKFREDIKDRIEEKMRERGFGREVKNEHRRHLKNAVYELEQRAVKAEQRYAEAQEKAAEIERRELELAEIVDAVQEAKQELNDILSKIQDEQNKYVTISTQSSFDGKNELFDNENGTDIELEDTTPNVQRIYTLDQLQTAKELNADPAIRRSLQAMSIIDISPEIYDKSK